MKIIPFLLRGSLIANGVLVLVACARLRFHPETPAASTRPPASQAPTTAPSPAGPGPETWSHLQNPDLRAYRTQLERAGFSPRLARALAAEELDRPFAARAEAIKRKIDDTPFWEQPILDPSAIEELRKIYEEKRQASQELLGPDPNDDSVARMHAQFPALSEDKITQLLSIQQTHGEQMNRILTSFAGVPVSSAARDKLLAVEQEQRTQLAQLLTPEELEDYQLRASPLAGQLRFQLRAFDGTDDEFRTLFRLQDNLADRLQPTYITPTPEELQDQEAARKELSEQIHAALGDERFAQYERSQDYNYQETYRLVDRLDLPRSVADDAWAVQQDIQQRATALRSNRTLTPEERTQQLAAMADEAKTRLTSMLGDRGYAAYQQYGGNWLQSLRPPPKR